MNQSDKPNVDGLMALAMNMAVLYRDAPRGFPGNCLADYDAVKAALRVGIERLAALAGPLEQPQEPKSDKANLTSASGVCDLQTALSSLARGFSTCPLRPLYTCHTAQEMDAWWMHRNMENENWVRSLAQQALAACEAVTGAVPSDKPAASSESSVSVPKEQHGKR